ncbi:hypothetical protein [Prochlorococcus sp. MIT 1201]|uniref:hypothetical protein n=1 Tax=Prochlorococcus sp. MIT 1201 TaxID=3082535 RepID=UPI0039A5F14F
MTSEERSVPKSSTNDGISACVAVNKNGLTGEPGLFQRDGINTVATTTRSANKVQFGKVECQGVVAQATSNCCIGYYGCAVGDGVISLTTKRDELLTLPVWVMVSSCFLPLIHSPIIVVALALEKVKLSSPEAPLSGGFDAY